MHYGLKDSEFEVIFEILLKIKGIHKKNRQKVRNFIEAIYYASRSGCQWRLLPKEYGRWRAIHKKFKAWSDRRIWEKIFKSTQTDPDMEWIMIDSTIVRAHACSASFLQHREALGRSKGGFSTKIHALTDALGNPLKFILTPGQQSDITQAKNLVEGIFDTNCLADKGYISNEFFNALKNRNCSITIPDRKNAITLENLINICTRGEMQLNVSLEKSNIFEEFLLDMTKLLNHIYRFCILLEH